MTDQQLLSWAINVLTREVLARTFGDVTFCFQDGKITTVKTVKSEKPIVQGN